MNDKLREAIEARDKYLEEHPHLQDKQKEIDETLDKCLPEDRAEVAMMLLMEGLATQLIALNALKKGLEYHASRTM